MDSTLTIKNRKMGTATLGASSITCTVSGAVPSFVNVIVYVIVSFNFTVLPLAGSDVFVPVTCGLLTVVVVFDLMKRALPLLPTIFQWIEITNIYTYTCLGEGHLSSSLKTSPIRLEINNL